jgi:uncharacterized protein YndB with AHSA1/START domain
MSNSRKIESEIEIDAPIEAVWKSLSDAAELMRWFPLDARAEPNAGGMVWYSWGPPYEGENRIEIWDPPHRLKLSDAAIGGHHTEEEFGPGNDPSTGKEPAARQIAMDFTLESAGGKTTLRLVHSGFGASADWDEEFGATSRGWITEFLGLKHYLEHHRGEDRRSVWARLKVEASREESWRRVMGPQGLNLSGLEKGDSFDRLSSFGSRFEGRVLMNQPWADFCAVLDNLNGAFFRMSNERWSKPRPHAEPNLWLSTYGLLNHQVLSLQANLTMMLMKLFPEQLAE